MHCPACHKENPPGATHCEFCRTPLPDSSSQFQPTVPISGVSVGDARFEPGSLIAGRYLVEREIGRGGMGVVYLVRDQKLHGKEVALKLISVELTSSHQGQERFVQEVLAAQELQHVNIVRVFHLDEVGGQSFFTMEYVPGRSLREIVEERKREGVTFTLMECGAVLLPVLYALDHAHTQSPPVIHRDIKPENIVVTGDLSAPQIKVLDFGLAKMLSPSRLTTTAMTMGTAYYMAPEQVQGARNIDQRADLFSAGVVLYEMLTGYVPSGRFKLPAELNPGLPAGIDDLVDKVLQQHPVDRHASAQDFAMSLVGLAKEAEEEAQRKAEEEARRKAEEEARGKAEEEARSKAEEEVRRKAEEEARRKAEEEARLKAEEETEPAPQAEASRNDAVRSGPRKLFWAAALALFAVAAFFVMNGADIFVLRPKPMADSASQAPAISENRALTIRTEPADADVTFIGSGLTYRAGMEVAAGTYEVEISRDGYLPRRHNFQVKDRDYLSDVVALDKDPSLSVTAESASPAATAAPLPAGPEAQDALIANVSPGSEPARQTTGSLSITSSPDKAKVKLDGKDVGETPLILAELEAGTHQVEVSLKDHLVKRVPVTVSAGSASQTHVDLMQMPGSLKVQSVPAGANVAVNGKPLPGVTPLTVPDLQPGSHSVALSLPGHEESEAKVEINPGDNSLKLTLKALPRPSLHLDLDPVGASVRFTDSQLEYRQGMEIEPGTYELNVSAPGFVTRKERVEVAAGADKRVRIELAKATGGLTVTGEPAGAQVVVDGLAVGVIPYSVENLPVGTHEVVISHDGYKPLSKQVEIKENQVVSLVLDLPIINIPRAIVGNGSDVSLSMSGNSHGSLEGSQASKQETENPQAAGSNMNRPVPGKSWKEPLTGMEFVWIPAGSFVMGEPAEEVTIGHSQGPKEVKVRNVGARAHRVVFTKGFWMGRHEVTQSQWNKLMDSNPSFFKNDNNPVESVSWHDCEQFIERLNKLDNNNNFELPSEAQWEYAATCFGRFELPNDKYEIQNIAWYRENSEDKTHPVGIKMSSQIGSYDMIGNVAEWCKDTYASYPLSQQIDPVNTSSGSTKVIRGGHWESRRTELSLTKRDRQDASFKNKKTGFRIVVNMQD